MNYVVRFRLPAAFITFLLISFPLISQNDQEAAFKPVEGLETWSHNIDISDYPAGTYNIIIKGSDKAGNEYVEGPFNIFIDPDSDKPVVNISNPEPQMKMNGNINIIGTCVDDDEVKRVEIKINDGVFQTADGTEFWSYYLDTEALDDGEYTITARGVDINELAGVESSVNFTLDRTAPRNEVLSYPNGALVNGVITIEGTTEDLNGISKLELSTDNGDSYSQIPVRIKRNEPKAEFKIRVDTRKLEDGPQIYWLRSTDKTGSVGLSSFLFFVDNKPPELEILYPLEDKQVNGVFSVIGRVGDEVGVDNLTYKIGREEEVEIPLSVGDPYWSQQFDFLNQEKADIRFTLTDKTGNFTMKRMQLLLDEEGDKPNLYLLSPEPDMLYKSFSVSGFVQDDDGVKEVGYSIDGGEQRVIPARHSFYSPVEDLEPGIHKLKIHAVDVNGIKSSVQEIVFKTVRGAPEIGFKSVIPSEGEDIREASQAVEITIDEYKTIEGSILFMNNTGSAVIAVDSNEEQKLPLKNGGKKGEKNFSISLKDIQPGYHSITVRASESEGVTAEKTFYFMMRGVEEAKAEENLFSADARFKDSGKPVGNNIRMYKDDEIVFYIDGGTVKRVEFSEETDFLKLSKSGSYVSLKTVSEGWADNLEINIETNGGKLFSVGPFSVSSDDTAPEVVLNTRLEDILVNNELDLAGTISDNVDLSKAEYSVNGGSFKAITVDNNEFSFSVNLADQKDGGVVLLIAAEDRIGNRSLKKFFLTKDTKPPTLKQLAPLPKLKANGVITFAGRTDDINGIRSVEYSQDGEAFEPLPNKSFPVNKIRLNQAETGSSGRIYRITDAAGNVHTFTPDIVTDIQGDVPVVRIQIPEEGFLAQDDFTLSGMVFDDDQVESIRYRIDDGEYTSIAGGNNFEVPFSIKDISDNEHRIEVIAVDINGVESEVGVLNIIVSKSEPASRLSSPDIESTVKGVVEISGMSSDPNGIKDVLLSYDNGNTFNHTSLLMLEAEVEIEAPADAVKWSYLLDSELLEDGSHSLLVKAVDQYDVSSIYTTLINIDNSPPVITLVEPEDGSRFSKSAHLKGRVTDNNQIEEVNLEIKHLTSQDEIVNMDLSHDEIISKDLDFTGFSAGWINMQLTAVDKTGNTSSLSRNVEIIESSSDDKIKFITPSKGEHLTGDVSVQGRIENMGPLSRIVLKLNEQPVADLNISEFGYFNTGISRDQLDDGEHSITLEIYTEDSDPVVTAPLTFFFKRLGPWINIDSFKAGDFALNRPWLSGTAGYDYLVPQLEGKELKSFIKEHEVSEVEISLDNGKTFEKAAGTEEWKFRLQTQELEDGELWVLARVRFINGSSAVAKTMIIVDETPPDIVLVSPGEGMRFNESLRLLGTGSDKYGLSNISVALREGNKGQYQVPSFVQGLYIDAHFLGSTYAELGVGLTFFDDTVKLQLQAGMAPPGRFTGAIFGLKLLANLAVIPWDYFFGYDMRFFSSSLAVGTTFNYFTMPDDDTSIFGENGLVLGALIAQLEMVKFDIPDWDMFSSYSFYTEMQFWFISSDVDAGVEPRLAFGLRADVF